MLKQNSHNEIYIDKDGIWYFREMEMERQDIVQYFYQYLRRDEEGHYLIEIGDDRCYVDVEDTPYVIRSVTVGISQSVSQLYVRLSLNDGSSERLNISAPLRIGDDHVLYCRVKRGEYEARFSRPAYYQFCEYITYDSRKGQYLLILNQHSCSLVFTGDSNDKTRLPDRELYKQNPNGGSNARGSCY